MRVGLSIVIVNWNTRDLLRNCLQSIYQNPPKDDFEVFVVDNASTDGSPEMVEKELPQVKLIKNKENLGFSKANNLGIKSSGGDYILLLNSDTQVLRDSLPKMVEYMDTHPKVGILGPQLIKQDEEIIQMPWGWFPSIFGEMLQKFFTPHRVQKSKISHVLTVWLQRRERKVPIVAG
ncbi:MAG: glycosyltransferase family 2 protein, partial [Actinomycetota bacterium]